MYQDLHSSLNAHIHIQPTSELIYPNIIKLSLLVPYHVILRLTGISSHKKAHQIPHSSNELTN